MGKRVSQYQQYWELMKQHRGQTLELQVPTEFQARICAALRKRRYRENVAGIIYYPKFSWNCNPIINGKQLMDIVHVVLPLEGYDTI